MNANFQYIIIAVMFLLSCYFIFRIFKKNFSSQKFKQKKHIVIKIVVVHRKIIFSGKFYLNLYEI